MREPAQAALARVGLAERAATFVADLSHGERRQLEIAMALAARQRMLLLDEPMAGMGLEESARLLEIAYAQGRYHRYSDRTRHRHSLCAS